MITRRAIENAADASRVSGGCERGVGPAGARARLPSESRRLDGHGRGGARRAAPWSRNLITAVTAAIAARSRDGSAAGGAGRGAAFGAGTVGGGSRRGSGFHHPILRPRGRGERVSTHIDRHPPHTRAGPDGYTGRDETRRAPKITKVGGQRPRASNVSGKRAGDESCMYARAGSGCPWPLCKYKIVSSTPASMAVEIPPLRAEIPEKRAESPPAHPTAQRIHSRTC